MTRNPKEPETMFEERIDFRSIFETAPGLYLILAPDAPRFTILAASHAYLKATLTHRHGAGGIIGMAMFDAFPDPPGDDTATGVANLRDSLERALWSKQADVMPVQHYNIRRPDGSWEERHWSPRNTPVVDRALKVCYLIHEVEDVTKLVHAQAAEQAARDAVEVAKNALEAAKADLQRQQKMMVNVSSESVRLRAESEALRAEVQSLMENRKKGVRRNR